MHYRSGVDTRVTEGFRTAIQQGRDSYEAEYRITRPSDGEVRWIYGRGRVIRDRDGNVLRYAGVDIDITARKVGEVAASRLISIVESSDDAIISKDLNGVITSWNAGAIRLYGFMPEEAIGKSITLIIPEDRQHEEPQILERIRNGERVDHYETVRRRKDGSLVDISLTVSPIRDAAGSIIGASKIARDISERRKADEMERLLLQEMQHRIKNLFSLAGGVVTLSARSGNTASEMVQSIRERLGALARAHALTLPDATRSTTTDENPPDLAALLEAILAPYNTAGEANISLRGPDVSVGRQAVSNLALLFYEFATNAAKYGAFSTGTGHLEVTWEIQDGTLELTWRESGGPPLEEEPTEEGFGSDFTERALASALRGSLKREYAEEGLILRMSVSLENLAH
jgi:PAS domain S-box-containing protein